MFKFIVSLFLMAWSAISWAGECHTINYSPYVFNYNFGTKTVTDPNQNKSGQVFPNAYTWNLGQNYTAYCSCSGSTYTANYFTTRTTLPVGHNDGSNQYYVVNDNIEMATSIYIGGLRQSYVSVPLNAESNYETGQSSCNSTWGFATGSQGRLSLYISKPFLGNNSFSVTVFSLYGTTNPYDALGPYPLSQLKISGSIIVPQTCTINAGSIITVDFGTMMSSSFKTAGQRPSGFTDKTFNVPVKCSNVGTSVNLSLRLTATPASGDSDAIGSNNSDVGVVVTNEQGNILKPNSTSSKVPFNADSSGNANVTLKAYPVSVTGKQPKEGDFNALACLIVEFA